MISQVKRLCTREKYLKIKKDIHELPYNTLTFLPEKPKNAGLIKKGDRDEKEFRAFNKIISFIFFTGKNSNLIILSNLSLRMF
jgi:hypothetical protein